MKYVALGEEEVGGGKQKEGRGPWHFLSNESCFFFFLEILSVGWYLAREQGLWHES